MTRPTAITPYLYYADGNAAMAFLDRAFGFRERMKDLDADGSLRHGEMTLDGVPIMLGCPPGHRTPKELGHRAGGLYVTVADVDAHYRQAVAAGADVEGPPADQPYGDRNYGARDPEGNQWWFASPVSTSA